MRSTDAPGTVPGDATGEGARHDKGASTPHSGVEFDPRDGFYPPGLASQIEAMEKAATKRPEAAGAARGPSPKPGTRVAAETSRAPQPASGGRWMAAGALAIALLGATWWWFAQRAPASAPAAARKGPVTSVAAPVPDSRGTVSSSNASAGSATVPDPAATEAARDAPAPATATVSATPTGTKADAALKGGPGELLPARAARPAATVPRPAPLPVRPVAPTAPARAEAAPPGPVAGGVTHTRGGGIAAPEAVVPTAPAPAAGAAAACSEKLAALGLCAPTQKGRQQ